MLVALVRIMNDMAAIEYADQMQNSSDPNLLKASRQIIRRF